MPENKAQDFGVAACVRESSRNETRCVIIGFLIALIVLFTGLGSTALFEPDEGRNAEKAREILLLHDWITPHQNFLPTLDKPIFFYWVLATAFKVFGPSEWSARLPSALAALGCLVLVYLFARRYWGVWPALWSCLVLLTSLQFVIFARLVLFDMTLTFFIAWALFSFYRIVENKPGASDTWLVISLYGAMALGTLTKGPVALVTPGLIIFCFVLMRRNWDLIKRLQLVHGVALYLAITVPWNVLAELKNPGYLRYFLWDEHVIRYLTPHFGRSKSWYYFLLVTLIGLLPWTLFLPRCAKDFWRERATSGALFLVLWIVLPVAFFSASYSKLPHYILPIYPALALLVGHDIGSRIEEGTQPDWLLLTPWLTVIGLAAYLLIGLAFPKLLAVQIRPGTIENSVLIVAAGLLLPLGCLLSWLGLRKGPAQNRTIVYLATAFGLALFVVLSTRIIAAGSFNRISKPLAQRSAPFVGALDQVVFFETYLEGVPFYLRVEKPIWLVQPKERQTIMASNYLGYVRPAAASGYGPVLLTLDEFSERWKGADQSLRIIVRAKNIDRLIRTTGVAPRQLAQFDEYLLVTNR